MFLNFLLDAEKVLEAQSKRATLSRPTARVSVRYGYSNKQSIATIGFSFFVGFSGESKINLKKIF